MSRNYKKKHLEKDGMYLLRIRPEGWTEDLIFDFEYPHGCGQAENGIGVRTSDMQGGGVLTLDDLVAMNKMIAFHIKRLAHDIGSNSTEIYDDYEVKKRYDEDTSNE